jgi:hypothetical protein
VLAVDSDWRVQNDLRLCILEVSETPLAGVTGLSGTGFTKWAATASSSSGHSAWPHAYRCACKPGIHGLPARVPTRVARRALSTRSEARLSCRWTHFWSARTGATSPDRSSQRLHGERRAPHLDTLDLGPGVTASVLRSATSRNQIDVNVLSLYFADCLLCHGQMLFAFQANRKADVRARHNPISPRLMVLTTHLAIAQHCSESTGPREVE